MDKKTNAILTVTSIQRLHKRNDNCINIIISPKKKIITPLLIFAKNKDNKKKQSEITGP